MKDLIYFALFLMVSQTGYGEQGHMGPNDTIVTGTVKVLDEEEQIVPEAHVKLLFTTTRNQEYIEGMGPSFIKEVKSNQDGQITFNENASSVGAFVSKEGYWQSSAGIRSNEVDDLRKSNDRKDPDFWTLVWNPTIVLTKKVNPRPMFADHVQKTFPGLNATYAFDFSANDWVRPHGKGIRKDMLLTVKGKAEKRLGEPRSWAPPKTIFEYDVTVTLHFPNEGDGFIPVKESEHPQSQVLLGREAPLEGYQDLLVLRTTDTEMLLPKEMAGYWFRARSRIDSKTGEIRGHYGKIKGDFFFQMTGSREPPGYQGILNFHYMFSPDTQRSMEYNGENLFEDGRWSARGVGSR